MIFSKNARIIQIFHIPNRFWRLYGRMMFSLWPFDATIAQRLTKKNQYCNWNPLQCQPIDSNPDNKHFAVSFCRSGRLVRVCLYIYVCVCGGSPEHSNFVADFNLLSDIQIPYDEVFNKNKENKYQMFILDD